jgi:hypothetical protein
LDTQNGQCTYSASGVVVVFIGRQVERVTGIEPRA